MRIGHQDGSTATEADHLGEDGMAIRACMDTAHLTDVRGRPDGLDRAAAHVAHATFPRDEFGAPDRFEKVWHGHHLSLASAC